MGKVVSRVKGEAGVRTPVGERERVSASDCACVCVCMMEERKRESE